MINYGILIGFQINRFHSRYIAKTTEISLTKKNDLTSSMRQYCERTVRETFNYETCENVTSNNRVFVKIEIRRTVQTLESNI